jgi:hypothetical protein
LDYWQQLALALVAALTFLLSLYLTMSQSFTTSSSTQIELKGFSSISNLVHLHQQVIDLVQFQLQIQMPLVFDTPKYAAPIIEEDKSVLVKKLMKEKKQVEMIKNLLVIAEHNINILMEEFPTQGTWNNNGADDGWN